MKIEQSKEWRPITIRLETRAETEHFLQIIDSACSGGTKIPLDAKSLAVEISNHFSEHIHL